MRITHMQFRQKQIVVIKLTTLMMLSVLAITSSAGTIQYSYDNMGRLSQAEYENGTAIEYSYDTIGNRVGHTLTLGGPTSTITASAGEHGSINPAGLVTVGEGTNYTFFMLPEPGYYLAQLLVNGAVVWAERSYTFSRVSGSQTIEALFAELPLPTQYSLIVEKNGTGAGTVIAEGIDCGTTCMNSYDSDTGLIVKAIPDPGSTFVGWEINGVPSGCLVTIDGPTTVTAIFDLE